MDRVAIGNRLKELIENSGIDRKILENSLSVHYDTIMKWFKGKAVPSHETLIELSDILGASIDFILKGKETQPKAAESKSVFFQEQIRFYKEKAEFFEMKTVELEHKMLSGRRAGDPKDLDTRKLRRVIENKAFPYGFTTE